MSQVAGDNDHRISVHSWKKEKWPTIKARVLDIARRGGNLKICFTKEAHEHPQRIRRYVRSNETIVIQRLREGDVLKPEDREFRRFAVVARLTLKRKD